MAREEHYFQEMITLLNNAEEKDKAANKEKIKTKECYRNGKFDYCYNLKSRYMLLDKKLNHGPNGPNPGFSGSSIQRNCNPKMKKESSRDDKFVSKFACKMSLDGVF
jgi:hypothetical protein